jgi:hypothetical protein
MYKIATHTYAQKGICRTIFYFLSLSWREGAALERYVTIVTYLFVVTYRASSMLPRIFFREHKKTLQACS